MTRGHPPRSILNRHPSPSPRLISSAQVKLAENFNGADLRNICTEAGMFAIRDERDYTVHDDFMKVRPAVRTWPPPRSKLSMQLMLTPCFGDGGPLRNPRPPFCYASLPVFTAQFDLYLPSSPL